MMRKVAPFVGLLMTIALLVFGSSVSAAPLSQGSMTATLSGTEEVPDPGDTDGSGSSTVRWNSDTEICFEISVRNITLPAAAAHIHEGAKGVAGPVAVPLAAPDANGAASGCAPVETGLAGRIRATPANFYVNVHTSDFPAGAVRGQLMMSGGGAAGGTPPTLPNTGADSVLPTMIGAALLLMLAGLVVQVGVRRRAE